MLYKNQSFCMRFLSMVYKFMNFWKQLFLKLYSNPQVLASTPDQHKLLHWQTLQSMSPRMSSKLMWPQPAVRARIHQSNKTFLTDKFLCVPAFTNHRLSAFPSGSSDHLRINKKLPRIWNMRTRVRFFRASLWRRHSILLPKKGGDQRLFSKVPL